MTRKRCAFLVPSYGWRDDMHGIIADKIKRGDGEVHLGDRCGWGEAHPELFAGMPIWIAEQAKSGAAYRPRHCETCNLYSPDN